MAQEAASGLGAPVYRGGIVEQTRTIYERVLLILEAAGANFGDVVKLVEYVAPAGLEDYPAVRSLRREYFGHDLPASTMLVVTQLLHPAAHIAIDMVAVTGTTKKISIHPAWSRPDPDGLWAGVQKGPLLFISGQFGVDPRAATSVGRGDLPKQTRQAYGNVQSIVEAAGARMDDVVKTVEFLVPGGLHDYRRTAEIRREYFQEPYPAATGVVVQGLPQPDWLIAVDAVAVVSEVKPVADGQ